MGILNKEDFGFFIQQVSEDLGLVGKIVFIKKKKFEIIAQGSEPKLEELLYFSKHGNLDSKIMSIHHRFQEKSGIFGYFHVYL